MFGKVVLVFLVGSAMLQTPIARPAMRCCLNPESHQASFSDGCCAAMPCCVISSDSATQPVIPAPISSQLAVFPAPGCLVSLIDFPARPQVACPARPPLVAHSPPPLAVTGIFLI